METRLLVVDSGVGTIDCSMILIGPSVVDKDDRNEHLLAHRGVRIAGNNFDIQLALKKANNTLASIGQLMQSAVTQVKCQPKVIFVTGETAKSPVLYEYLSEQMPNMPLVIGDHFGSVSDGLARWANNIYR